MEEKKEYKAIGSYSINGGEEKEFTISYTNTVENEENISKLFDLLNSPVKLILNGGKLGVTGIKKFFLTLFLFTTANTILFFYAISRLFVVPFEASHIFYVILVFVIGLGVTIYAQYRTYHYVIIDTIRVIYENLTPFFEKISAILIDKASGVFKGSEKTSDTQLAKKVNIGKLVNSSFKKMPKILRKGITLVLSKVPIIGMLMAIRNDIVNGDSTIASNKLHQQIDGFISNTIFGNNTIKWIWWLLPLNIIFLVFLIHSKIG